MNVTVRFEPTNGDLMRAGGLGLLVRPVILATSVGFFVVVPWISAIAFTIAKWAGFPIPWLPILGLVVVPLASIGFFLWLPVLLYRGSPALKGEQTYEFSEEHIHATSRVFDSTVKWDLLTRFKLHRLGLLVLSGKAPSIFVPGRVLDDASREALRGLLESKKLKAL